MSGALLSNEACALLLGVKPQSLRIRRMRGGGPPFIRLGGPSSRAFYREEDVTRWLAERPAYSSTHEERAALHKKAQAAKPTRRRLVSRQAKSAAPPAESKPGRRPGPAPRPTRKKP